MKIKYLQISNVLSFKYYENFEHAPKIEFTDGLNILIGQNGAGKSTALETINFIFKKVLFVPYRTNYESYSKKDFLLEGDRKQILMQYDQNNHIGSFRLEPNWNSENQPQQIAICISLDEIDLANIRFLEENRQKLNSYSGLYSHQPFPLFKNPINEYRILVRLDNVNKTFSLETTFDDSGFHYLVRYDYYKQLIEIHNQEKPGFVLPSLKESFSLIGSYRNYHAFTESVSLATEAEAQIDEIKRQEYARSTNVSDQNEPGIFNLVRLRIAELHQKQITTKSDVEEATDIANSAPFLMSINQKLALINLSVKITLIKLNTWAYSFQFHDTKRNKVLKNINSLSAGQKSIIHLIFESYGRGELKGGVIIIDEPEIHLHYQFQHEYLKIIEKLNQEQNCQYLIVTHSESLISSNTIDRVKRFALDEQNYSIIKYPNLETEEKTLVKILDNTRSTYAFFAKKVVLVEGDSDRYFFKALLQAKFPHLIQEIAVIDIGGKGNYQKWKDFFEGFGLKVFFVCDFDNVFSLKIAGRNPIVSEFPEHQLKLHLITERLKSLNGSQKTQLSTNYANLVGDSEFLTSPNAHLWNSLLSAYRNVTKIERQDFIDYVNGKYTNISSSIDVAYADNVFILKKGPIESYTMTVGKDLSNVIPFCETIGPWFDQDNELTNEIRAILNLIVT